MQVSSFNDRVQAWLFNPNKLAPTFPESAVTRPFPFNAYYPEEDAPEVDEEDYRLEVGGLVDGRGPWTLDQLRALPQETQITRHICVEGWSAIGKWTPPTRTPSTAGSAPTSAASTTGDPPQRCWRGHARTSPPARNTAVYDDADPSREPVGTVNAWPAPLTVPGGGRVDSWAISSVTVAPTHRRRGVARALLGGELRTAHALGLPLAILTVSESVIYGRWGFGPATWATAWSVDTKRVRWVGGETPGRLSFAEAGRVRRDRREGARPRDGRPPRRNRAWSRTWRSGSSARSRPTRTRTRCASSATTPTRASLRASSRYVAQGRRRLHPAHRRGAPPGGRDPGGPPGPLALPARAGPRRRRSRSGRAASTSPCRHW